MIAEAVKVAVSQFLPINTLTLLAPCSHFLFNLHAKSIVMKIEHSNKSEKYSSQLVEPFIIKALQKQQH